MAELQYPKAQAEEKLTALQKFFRKIKLALNNILERIRNKRSGDLMITAEGKTISKDVAMVNDLLKKVRQGLVNVRTNYDAYVAGAEVKSAGDGKIRKMYDNGRNYSYSELVAKKHIQITDVLPVSDSEANKYCNNGELFAKDMRKLASAAGNPKNTPTTTYLYCEDINTDLLITKDSFKHSIGRRNVDRAYIAICKKMAEILEKAIVVNELEARPGSDGGYVLLGVCQDNDNYIFVRALTEKNTYNLIAYDVLTTITKKSIEKGDVGLKPQAFTLKSGSRSSPTFSITGVLQIVKDIPLINSVLSDDVIEKLGVERIHDPNITPSLKHQHISSEADEQAKADELDALRESNKSFTEKSKLQKQLIGKLRNELKAWKKSKGSLDYSLAQKAARKLVRETHTKPYLRICSM